MLISEIFERIRDDYYFFNNEIEIIKCTDDDFYINCDQDISDLIFDIHCFSYKCRRFEPEDTDNHIHFAKLSKLQEILSKEKHEIVEIYGDNK